MSDFKYPQGYTPMTDDEMLTVWNGVENGDFRKSFREIEQAVLSRLPKPDAEPVAYRMQYTYPNGGIYYVYAGKGHVGKVFIQYLTEKTPLYTHPPQNTAEREALVRRIDAWEWFDFVTDTERLFKDLRAYLVKGGVA